MEKIEVERMGDKVMIASNNVSIEFDARFGEKGYPFNCAMYNVKLSDNLVSKIQSSKIVQVDTDLSYFSQSVPDPKYYDLYECGIDLYLVPKFGYTTNKLTEVLYELVKEMLCTDTEES